MSAERLYERVTTQMERFDRCIAEAECRIETQEQLVREAALIGHGAARETFELQKLQLLVAILREARGRMYGHAQADELHA